MTNNINKDDNGSIENKKFFVKKLHLDKETIRQLKAAELKRIPGGAAISGIRCTDGPVCTDYC